jgi:hypothetical protein
MSGEAARIRGSDHWGFSSLVLRGASRSFCKVFEMLEPRQFKLSGALADCSCEFPQRGKIWYYWEVNLCARSSAG